MSQELLAEPPTMAEGTTATLSPAAILKPEVVRRQPRTRSRTPARWQFPVAALITVTVPSVSAVANPVDAPMVAICVLLVDHAT